MMDRGIGGMSAKDLADRNNVILDAKYLESLINSSAAKDKLKMLELLYSTEKNVLDVEI